MAKQALAPAPIDNTGEAKPDEIIAAVITWSQNVIESPHPVFGGLPICPFARAARVRETIRFHVMPFDLHDPLELNGGLMALIADFAADTRWETFFVIHPDPYAVGARALEEFVTRLGDRFGSIAPFANLRVFEAHPLSNFCVGGVYTRRSPYPSFQILSHERLKTGSDTLLASRYYDGFTPEMLRAVGMPRTSQHC